MNKKDINVITEAYDAMGLPRKAENMSERKAAAVKREFAELIKEYIMEAEHQDGIGYWNQFTTFGDILDDIKAYSENRSVIHTDTTRRYLK